MLFHELDAYFYNISIPEKLSCVFLAYATLAVKRYKGVPLSAKFVPHEYPLNGEVRRWDQSV